MAIPCGLAIALSPVSRASAQQPPVAVESTNAVGVGTTAAGVGTNLVSDTLRLLVDRALVTSKGTDFAHALSWIDSVLARHPNDAMLQHYRGFVLYRKASWLVATKQGEREAKRTFEDAERMFAVSSSTLPWPENFALQSAVVGQLIGLGGPLAGMRLGGRASRLLDSALVLGPDNPRVWMLKGVSELFRPKLFGGSAEKAEASFQRALSLFAKDRPTPPAPWWGEAETLGWLGQAYLRLGRPQEAERAFERALQLEPGNRWVIDYLLPMLRESKR